jgi:(E)-4-hydroxy-3-methylbut-2-enyl-diphosphate synthase
MNFDPTTIHSFNIGNCIIGGNQNISIQSMTSTSTKDIEATVQQCIRMVKVGAQMIRITARDVKEAENLKIIKDELINQGFDIPIIADIHFNPKVAEVAATLVDKVRINPGNYIDKKTGKTEWSDEEFKREQENIKERLSHLVKICKEHETAIRIGVNHGSLSERMINQHGDTAEGMVESALEFIRIFKELSFDKLVISLKASNVIVMVRANQLMAQRMQEENLQYPLHLGVTEAGDAEDGRIKSACGIGFLLSQGIGNTIRVSLTEEPEFELPVAQMIIDAAKRNPISIPLDLLGDHQVDREKVSVFGGNQVPVVIDSFENVQADLVFKKEGWWAKDGTQITRLSPLPVEAKKFEKPVYYKLVQDQLQVEEYEVLASSENLILLVEKTEELSLDHLHNFLEHLRIKGIHHPIVLKIVSNESDFEKWMVENSIVLSSFLLASKIDGVWLDHPQFSSSEIALAILQASRKRISKTDYIACPSCGRTLFNIQEKLQEVKAKTSSFKGLKIAVMGCIVNGLGEMADADFGYVGAGKGKVNIYKGKQLIYKNVDETIAAEKLLEIISSKP